MPDRHIVYRAWSLYRRSGLAVLGREALKKIHRQIPWRYKILYREYENKLAHEPKAIAHPLSIVWVDPAMITRKGPRFYQKENIGRIEDGDWDRERIPLRQNPRFKGLKQRFVDGRDWEETAYYEWAEQYIAREGSLWGHESMETFVPERFSYLDDLYDRIESEGYKPQSELTSGVHGKRHEDKDDAHHRSHEVGCNIARDGELLLNSGHHRLSIAKFLGIDEIPVQIIVRHERWQRIRDAVVESSQPERVVSELDVDLSHPDLEPLVRERRAKPVQSPSD